MTYGVPAAGVAGTDVSRLIGSAYSPFIKQEVYGNNSVVLESINEVGVLTSMLLNCQLNDADKRGLSPAFGFAFNDTLTATALAPANINVPYQASATAGHRIWQTNSTTAVEGLVFEYAIPLVGILGSGTDKFLPIGALFGLRLELTMDTMSRYVFASTANILTSATITEFEFVGTVIELAPEAQMLIEQANPEKIHIRTATYRQASNSLPGGTTSGANDLLVGVRVSSLKSVYMVCSPANANEGKFAGVNPNLDQGTCLIIAGLSYPQRTLNPSGHTSECYLELSKSFGALNIANFNGCISKQAYYTSSQNYGLCAAYSTNVANVIFNPSQFYMGIDTEVVARKQNLLSGINVNASPMFFRAQIGSTALSGVPHTCNFFGHYDVILELDCASKNIIAKF